MEQIVAATLGGGGLLSLLFVFGRRAFVKWAQESVQVNSAEAASAIVVMLRQQLEEFKKENTELRVEIGELRKENQEFRAEIGELRAEIKKIRGL